MPTTARRYGAALLLAVVLAGCGDSQQTRCEEDMDCWNCLTMGNGVCGPS